MAGPDKAKTKGAGDHDPRKPHGDKLGAATGAPAAASSDRPATGDSPKRQGDPMAEIVRSKR